MSCTRTGAGPRRRSLSGSRRRRGASPYRVTWAWPSPAVPDSSAYKTRRVPSGWRARGVSGAPAARGGRARSYRRFGRRGGRGTAGARSNYDLRVAVRFGSLSYPVRWSQGGGGVLRTREGRVTEVTGALGGGEHALAVQMNGGTVRLQVVP